MKIHSARIKQLPGFTAQLPGQKHQNQRTVNEQGLHPLHTSRNTDLREQILAIQKAKASLGIENLAASDLDSWFASSRIEKANWMAKSPHNPDDFWKLEARLQAERDSDVMVAITYAMAKIVEGLEPDRIPRMHYPDSNLMKTAIDKPPYNYSRESSAARHNAAYTLKTILEKIGDSIADEATIINLLLNAPTGSVREEGVIAAENTYKHSWRNNIEATGLIPALRKEEEDNLRAKIAQVIINADPKSILQEYLIPEHSEQFCPINRCLTDRSFFVRNTILAGLARLMLAQERRGVYYNNFSEIPDLSAQNRIDCFSYALKIFEQLMNKGFLESNELKSFHNCCNTIVPAISDEAIDFINRRGRYSEYKDLINKLAQVDLIKFVKTISSVQYDDPRWKEMDLWSDASPMINGILLARADTYENPLKHYLLLRADIVQMKYQSKSTDYQSKMDNVIEKIDDAIEHYLTYTVVQTITWGDSTSFNLTIADLIDVLKRSKVDSCKHAILDLLMELTTNKLSLDNFKRTSLEKVLEESNKSDLKQILSDTIHDFESLDVDFFLTPDESTLKGKALIVYKRITRSFKDYYGMQDLKEIALEMSAQRLEGHSTSSGLLLSGDIGMGKSFFAEVLANELGLPLKLLLGSKVEEKKSGRLQYSVDDTEYTLNQYLDEVRFTAPCVFLIDEIEELASRRKSPKTTQLLRFLKRIVREKLPIIVIATTNYPRANSIRRLTINKYGASPQTDQILSRRIHPDFFKVIQPCYLLCTKSAGSTFAYDYLSHLLKIGRIKGSLNLKSASKLARGLAPANIMSSLSDIPSKTLSPGQVISTIKKLKIETDETIELREGLIKTKVEDLVSDGKHSLKGSVDYTELAIVAEDMPDKLIVQVLNNAPRVLEQRSLLSLFRRAVE